MHCGTSCAAGRTIPTPSFGTGSRRSPPAIWAYRGCDGRVCQPSGPGDAHPAGHEPGGAGEAGGRSEEHTSELQSLMRISYAVFCLKKKKTTIQISQKASSMIIRYSQQNEIYRQTH